jgi:hypothetical protein
MPAPGRYRITATARDAFGDTSKAVTRRITTLG